MDVSLVIPGRNAAATLPACLASVMPLLESGELREILFVDDASTDRTAEIAATSSARLVRGTGAGPGAARNLGWRAASAPLIWFVDADCVVEEGALARLLEHLDDPAVAGCGGSYVNMSPESRLARLIQAEIEARHAAMGSRVDFLGSFNVLYRKEVLAEVGGFDEARFNGPGSPGAEDAELAYRLHERGHELAFEPRSHVGHFHPRSLSRYLGAQRRHGFWRVQLYLRHPQRSPGDSYSGWIDHLQPPLAVLFLAALPLVLLPTGTGLLLLSAALLAAAQAPMTLELVRRRGAEMAWFAPLSFLRAFARGVGMLGGLLALLLRSPGPRRGSSRKTARRPARSDE